MDVWCGYGGGETTASGLMEGERPREFERGEKGFFFSCERRRDGVGSLPGEVLISAYEAVVVCKLSSSFFLFLFFWGDGHQYFTSYSNTTKYKF